MGGLYLPAYMAFVGPQAVESLRSLSADVAVVGCDGLSSAEGLTMPHQLVAEIGTILIERARRTVVVADSSKIGRRGFTPIAPATAIDVLVTDEHADAARAGRPAPGRHRRPHRLTRQQQTAAANRLVNARPVPADGCPTTLA